MACLLRGMRLGTGCWSNQVEFKIGYKRVEHDEMVVRVAGELDLSTTPDFEAVIKEVSSSNPRVLVIDMRDLSYINSSGMYVLLKTQFRLSQEGGEVVIVGASPEVLVTLELIGVPLRIRCVNTMDEVHNPPPRNRNCRTQV